MYSNFYKDVNAMAKALDEVRTREVFKEELNEKLRMDNRTESFNIQENSSSMMKQYRDNEDNNLHAKNLEMLAKAFGSPAEKKYASEKAKWETSLTDKDFKVDRAMEKKINSYFNRLSENVRIDEKIRMFPKTQAKIMARGNQQDAQSYNYSMNLDKDSINPEDRESIPAQKKARGRHARAAMRYGRIARGEPAFKKSPNDPKSNWANEEVNLLANYLLDEGYTIDDIQNMTEQELRYAMNEAKMENAEILKAAKALAANGKDEKTKSFGKGLVSFYEKNKSFTPDQVAGLQNIMKNASFQMAKD